MTEVERIQKYFNKVDTLSAVCRSKSNWAHGDYPELEIGKTYKVSHIGVLRSSTNIMLTDRGVSFGYNNLVVDFRNIADMKEIVPMVIMDCTHSVQRPSAGNGKTVGDRKFVPSMALAAKAFGATGYFFEVHPTPDSGLSDAANMLELDQLENLIIKLLQ